MLDSDPSLIHTLNPGFVLSLFDTGLSVLRHLKDRGIATFGFDHIPTSAGFYTQVGKTELCPSPLESPKKLLEFLIARAKLFKSKPVLFPASDLYAKFISDNREDLAPLFLFILPEPKVANYFFSKAEQGEWALQAGAVIPKEIKVFANDIRQQTNLKYPVFIKGLESYLWQLHFYVKGFVAKDEVECSQILERMAKLNINVLVQEIIPGPPTNNYEISYYVTSRGDLFGPFIMRKLRQYPVQFGVATIGESIHSEEIKGIADSLMQKMQIRGFANMELKWDPREKTYKYIETNIRIWQQIDLCRACGWDLVWNQYLDLTEQKTNFISSPQPYRSDFKWIDPWNDIYSFLEAWGRRDLSFTSWYKSLKNIVSCGIYSKNDPKPFFQWRTLIFRMLSLVKFFLIQFKKRLVHLCI